MKDYHLLETSSDVSIAIKKSHGNDLVVYECFTAIDDANPIVSTTWGIKGAYYPILKQETTWDKTDIKYERENEITLNWLCLPIHD